jgi:hypothetical protein
VEQPTDDQLEVRASNRERQRRHRQREAKKRAHSVQTQQVANERAERSRRGPHFLGESPPKRSANTFADELQIHREFLRALGKEDVRDGETLRTAAKRAFEAWLTGPFTCRSCGPPFYAPAFNRVRQQFDPDFGFGIGDVLFEDIWTSPKDCTGEEVVEVGAFAETAEAVEIENRNTGTDSRTSIIYIATAGTDFRATTKRD